MTTVTSPEIGESLQPRMPSGIGRLLVRRAGEAAWVMPAMLGVIGLAAILYVVNLTVSNYANTYYSAAALAGSQSWSAWFFGSVDSANFITVDKPPLGTMLIGLSVRLFGLSSWSILLPQALAGVATVGVLMATIRRTFGPVAAIIAGLVTALTPVAVLIFRYNNPDALLTLLFVVAAYAFIRALESGRLRWVIVASALVGFAFLTKYLQAYLILPAFAITYAIAAPGDLQSRAVGLVTALTTVILTSGWWVAIMEVIPAVARPYIGGSTSNSVIELLFGYDGLGRIFGQGGGGGGGGGGFSGTAGFLRLVNTEFGGQIAWLLPLALLSIAIGLIARHRALRTDTNRAAYLMWGLWLTVHLLVFSFMSGIIHTYYAVAMAPAIGALVGGGLVELWRFRKRVPWGGIGLGAAILGSAVFAWQLLERTPSFAPGLGIAIVGLGLVAAVAVAIPVGGRFPRIATIGAGLGVALLLAGPAAYALDTMQTAYSGGDPSAGPAVQTSRGFGNGGPNGGFAGQQDGGIAPGGTTDGAGLGDGGPPGGGAANVDSALVDYLVANRGSATWIVAVSGANEAGSIELATGLPVMAMGGFNGGDPAPTVEQLAAYVANGQLRYVLLGGQGGGGASSSDVSDWVIANGTAVTGVGNGTLYDLSGGQSAGS
jgi:4-amino-4-deoxy-L-arabinose transferase-like glycosyltransferase